MSLRVRRFYPDTGTCQDCQLIIGALLKRFYIFVYIVVYNYTHECMIACFNKVMFHLNLV